MEHHHPILIMLRGNGRHIDKERDTEFVALNKSIFRHLMPMQLQYKVVQFLSSYIPTCDYIILNLEEEYINIAPSHKWKVSS